MTIDAGAEQRRARALIDVGRWEAARVALGRALAANPDSVDALCLLAYCDQMQGDYPAMLDTARRAVAADPDDEWAHRLVAAASRQLNLVAEAVAASREAVELAPWEADAHHSLAASLHGAGDLGAALESADEACRLAPEEPRPHGLRGLILIDLGRVRAAEAAFQQALAVAPNHPGTHNDLGYLYMRRGKIVRALLNFAAAGRASPAWELPARNTQTAFASLGWHLEFAAATLLGLMGLLAWEGAALRALAGTAALLLWAALVGWVLRVLPAGLRRAFMSGAPRRASTWVGAVVLAMVGAQAYLPVSGTTSLCVATVGILAAIISIGRYGR